MSEHRPHRKLAPSDLRPCDGCGGDLVPIFWHVTVRPAAFNAGNVNTFLGLHQHFQGRAPKLAEHFMPGPVAEVTGDPELRAEVYLCTGCYCGVAEDVQPLAAAVETATKAQEEREAKR